MASNTYYRYSEKEIKDLLKTIVILVDTREQENSHILNYFDKKKIQYKKQKLNAGDYSCYIPANTELGITRDLYLSTVIEKKNSVDELAQSFKDRNRFEAEFIRAAKKECSIMLLVEDGKGYQNIINHHYRSQYEPKALLGSLKSFENRYGFTTAFIDKQYVGNWIYHTLYYAITTELKR